MSENNNFVINDDSLRQITKDIGLLFNKSSYLLQDSLLDSIGEVNIEEFNDFIVNLQNKFLSLKEIIEDKINNHSFTEPTFSKTKDFYRPQNNEKEPLFRKNDNIEVNNKKENREIDIVDVKNEYMKAYKNISLCESLVNEFLDMEINDQSVSDMYHKFRNTIAEMFKDYSDTIKSLTNAISLHNLYNDNIVQKCIEENGRLLNQIRMKEGKYQVYVRIKPDYSDEVVVHSFDPYSINVREKKYDICDDYHYDYCFNEKSTQLDVFNRYLYVNDGLLNGINYTLLGFGQTGSGKTYSLMGPSNNVGLTYRLLDDLLKRISDSKLSYRIKIGIAELCNEELYDLLAPGKPKITIKAIDDNVSFRDLKEYEIENNYDITKYLAIGNSNRSIISVESNQFSTRSHYFIIVKVTKLNEKGTVFSEGKLTIGDIASFDRTPPPVKVLGKNTPSKRETSLTNRSVSSLLKVITALRKNSQHIPFRDSKLTLLLKNSLKGNCNVMFLCTVKPTLSSVNDSSQTLQFAQGLYDIDHPAAKKAIVSDKSTIQSLRNELEACYQLLSNDEDNGWEEMSKYKELNDKLVTKITECEVYINEYLNDIKKRDDAISLLQNTIEQIKKDYNIPEDAYKVDIDISSPREYKPIDIDSIKVQNTIEKEGNYTDSDKNSNNNDVLLVTPGFKSNDKKNQKHKYNYEDDDDEYSSDEQYESVVSNNRGNIYSTTITSTDEDGKLKSTNTLEKQNNNSMTTHVTNYNNPDINIEYSIEDNDDDKNKKSIDLNKLSDSDDNSEKKIDLNQLSDSDEDDF